MNVFYVSLRTTENYEFDKIRTVGVTGNAINYKNSQGDNSIICSTRDDISQPYRAFSPQLPLLIVIKTKHLRSFFHTTTTYMQQFGKFRSRMFTYNNRGPFPCIKALRKWLVRPELRQSNHGRFRERGALSHLSFLEPYADVTYLTVCPKNGRSGTMPLQILLCPENFLIKHILKTKIVPPKNVFCRPKP